MPLFGRRRERQRARETQAVRERHDREIEAISSEHQEETHPVREWFGRAAQKVTVASGSVWAFASALGIVVVWAVTGPLFHFTDTWQLVINTGTTIVTFLMVFLIQHSQNRDTRALHIKLNELIAAVEGASNHLIDVEDLSETELDKLEKRFQALAESVRKMHGATEASSEDKAARTYAKNLDKKFHD